MGKSTCLECGASVPEPYQLAGTCPNCIRLAALTKPKKASKKKT